MAETRTLEVIDLSKWLPRDVAERVAPRVAQLLPAMVHDIEVVGVEGPRICVLIGPHARLRAEYYPLVDEVARRLGVSWARYAKRRNQIPVFILGLLGAFIGYAIACHYIPSLPGCRELSDLWKTAYNMMKTLLSAAMVAGIVALAGYAYRAWGE